MPKSYTYNTDGTLNTKTDAKNQVFTYSYDGYKRVTQISVGGNVLRTFMYDSNTLDNTFSGSYTAGRLVAVQHSAFNPGTVSAIQFTEMYSYTQPGQAAKKRLQVNETLPYGQGQNVARTLNLDATQTYDTEGKMTSVNYPTTYGLNGAATTGPTYSYQFDNMSRPSVLTDQNSAIVANNVQYGPANELHHISYGGVNETRSYNAMLQMTGLSIPGQLSITYNFSGNTNNGKITSQTDNLSGETISYQYDSLNRLLSASATGWNQTFGYDGFGSLVSKSGTNAPVLSIGVDPATNRIVGQQYDANGNQLTGGLGYDPENRIQTAAGVQYAYDNQSKRIWKGIFDGNGNLTAQEAYFYGVGGQKLGTYALTVVQQNNQQPQLTDSNTDLATYFGTKCVGKTVNGTLTAFVQDRLGSRGKYYPYGEERGSSNPPNGTEKFTGYIRDTETGLDYAADDNSYYTAAMGRFLTLLRIGTRGKPSDPGSWNLYRYEGSDPVNNVSEPAEDPCDFVNCDFVGGGPPPADCPNEGCDPEPQTGGGATLLPHSRIVGFQKALDALNSPECAEALGAVNPEAAKLSLNNQDVYIDDLGRPTVTTETRPDGRTGYILKYDAAITEKGMVTVNAPVFLNPSEPISGPPGLPFKNMLEVLAQEFNLKPLTTDDFQAIVLLHELGHLLNGFADDRTNDALKEANTQTVIDKCFGFLKKN